MIKHMEVEIEKAAKAVLAVPYDNRHRLQSSGSARGERGEVLGRLDECATARAAQLDTTKLNSFVNCKKNVVFTKKLHLYL